MGLFDGTALERPVLCDRCQQELRACNCPALDTPPTDQLLKIRTEKRKRGKLVTVVAGFHCSDNQLQEVLSYLKTQCGAGGTVCQPSDGLSSIELQGEHPLRIADLLSARGYRLAKSKKN